MTAILVAQTIIPLLLVIWMMAWRRPTVAGVAVQMTASVILLLSLAKVGLWLFPPWWTPYAAAALVTIAAGWQLIRHRRNAAPRGRWGWSGMVVFVAVAAIGIRFGTVVRKASTPPSGIPVIDLDWPLGDGRFLVVNGGNDALLNAHQKSMDSTIVRLRPWRGNGHAVDIIAIDRMGWRARGFLPADPARYRIHGTPVIAPCRGTIVVALDGLPDMRVPEYDRAHMAGNHVILACHDVHVVLAHLRRGSVRVRVGDVVPSGLTLGTVGNSGGSNEPHLHIHAQRPGIAGAPFAGDPLPIRLNGRYLIRGDRVNPRTVTEREP